MASTIKIKHHPKGYRQLLTAPAVAADLERRAEAIATAANAAGSHVVRSEIGRNRARAAVITADVEAMKAEARNRNLTRAVDAGRG